MRRRLSQTSPVAPCAAQWHTSVTRHACALNASLWGDPHMTLASSQLRNPLHAMMGAVTVMETGGTDEAELAWQIKALRHGVDVMYGITSGGPPARARE